MSPEPRAAYRPGYEKVAEQIVEYIVDSGMKPGDRLPTEQELADLLSVSRGVLREAIKLLAAIGRVSPQRGRGLYVGPGEPKSGPASLAEHEFVPGRIDHVEQLLEFRALQDSFAAQSAAINASPREVVLVREALERCDEQLAQGNGDWPQADTAFHLAIATASGNMFVRAALEGLRALQLQVSILALRGDPDADLIRAQAEHRAIFDAISAGDPVAASAAARAHVEHTAAAYRREIERLVAETSGRSALGRP